MNFEKLKKLSFKEKLVFLGGILVVLGSFMPWYYNWPVQGKNYEPMNGLGGISVLGFVAGILALVYFILPFWGQKRPKLEISSQKFYYYCGLVVILTTCLKLLISPYNYLSFGWILVLLGGIFMAFPGKIANFFVKEK